MKKILIIASVILIVTGCNNNPESIRKKIIFKKEQISRINQSIKKLEDKLHKDTANALSELKLRFGEIRY